MKYYGRSQEVCEEIINQFKTGNLPEALSLIFVHRKDNVPSRHWSFLNRFTMAIHGTHDARGFKQWQDAGRKVKKGAKAFFILAPLMGKKENPETGEKEPFIYGFKSVPVFRIESTEIFNQDLWESSGSLDQTEEQRLAELPLVEVAKSWGLHVTSYNGEKAHYYGFYRHGEAIAPGVQNLATWAHELVHAADDKNHTITKKPGQQLDNELVAELGGATLLQIMGYKLESDIGGAWKYINVYTDGDQDKAIKFCMKLLNRTCKCIDTILDAAEKINGRENKAA